MIPCYNEDTKKERQSFYENDDPTQFHLFDSIIDVDLAFGLHRLLRQRATLDEWGHHKRRYHKHGHYNNGLSSRIKQLHGRLKHHDSHHE